ncbi:D-alanyl-D-alanine carboxypeptidase/D-alanyl-D-alanine-endopeptidase [Saccharopolyspora griseoalba]|uniref:D-alanyl-D-alanine carboxypeptidase/D-alanyl-D-alanine-endopeptidase n=1 Tax=Saccharopolyspora griseoalba TaxID=1431848 RepID=A0ABW2LF14_9PSEU
MPEPQNSGDAAAETNAEEAKSTGPTAAKSEENPPAPDPPGSGATAPAESGAQADSEAIETKNTASPNRVAGVLDDSAEPSGPTRRVAGSLGDLAGAVPEVSSGGAAAAAASMAQAGTGAKARTTGDPTAEADQPEPERTGDGGESNVATARSVTGDLAKPEADAEPPERDVPERAAAPAEDAAAGTGEAESGSAESGSAESGEDETGPAETATGEDEPAPALGSTGEDTARPGDSDAAAPGKTDRADAEDATADLAEPAADGATPDGSRGSGESDRDAGDRTGAEATSGEGTGNEPAAEAAPGETGQGSEPAEAADEPEPETSGEEPERPEPAEETSGAGPESAGGADAPEVPPRETPEGDAGARPAAETGTAEPDPAEPEVEPSPAGRRDPVTEGDTAEQERVEGTGSAEPGAVAEPEAPAERTQKIARVTDDAPAPAEGAAESTALIPKIDAAPAEPAEREAERTQRIPRVPAETPPESASERTARIEASDLAELRGSAPADAERTQQIPRPDFEEPRPASPADFSGLAAPQEAAPAEGASGATVPVESAQRAVPQHIPSQEDGSGSRRWGLVGLAAALVVVLGAGIAFVPRLFEQEIADPPAPVRLTDPAIEPLARQAPEPTRSGVERALTGPAASPALGQLGGIVLDSRTGETLWERSPAQAMMPASTGKLLAMSAVLLSMDHDARLTTKVVRGSAPGSIVLVGGGDPTLSKLGGDRESVYPGAPRLDDLVTQVERATGGNVTSVSVDTSRYTGPTTAPGWLPEDVEAGYYSPIEPVMLDGGRADPAEDVSTRSPTPALQAGQELAERLGVSAPVSPVEAPANAQVLGQVRSAPMYQLVDAVMQHSDNVLAEALTREVAIATGEEPSFAGGVRAVREVLRRNGFDLGGSTMSDGSGLSLEDRVTPKLLSELMRAVTRPANPDGSVPDRTARLRALIPALPIAGGSGSLEDRYRGSAGQGWVRAKTGTLDGANSLAGTVVTEDGRQLVFAMISNGTSSTAARPALDELADTLRSCGCR